MAASALDTLRQAYAEQVAAAANISTPALIRAFATVPRERFLGPGPWQIAVADPNRPGAVTYQLTPDDNPGHVYRNVLVAVDRARELNNGHPSSLAMWIDALRLRAGDAFLHIGCGVGYYTSLAAEVVGTGGRVVGIEIDAALAERARDNCRDYPHVSVVAADGATYEPQEKVDAVLVNAGFTHPLPVWCESLKPGGRMIVPVTAARPNSPITAGCMVLITRESGQVFRARAFGPIMVFGSTSGRQEALNATITDLSATRGWRRLKTLRTDVHTPDDSCCIHAEGTCLSSRDVSVRGASIS